MNKVNYAMRSVAIALAASFLLLNQPGWSAQNYHSRRVASTTYRHTNSKEPAGSLRAAPLIKVPYRSWLPKKAKPRLVLLCIHALGLSSKSYDNFGRRMARSGIPTYALDVRGFGNWMKQPDKDHLDFEACLTDIEQGVKTLHSAYPGIPVFLVGESMGGAIAIQAASRYPDKVNGLVCAVPSSTERGSNTAKSTLVVAYRTTTAPGSDVDMSPVIVDGATSDPALRQKIEAEPLNRMELSRKELAQFEKFMKETHTAAPLVERTPSIVLVAYKDRLVTPEGSVELFEEMTTPQKLMIGDGNSEHLMLEEGQMTSEIEWMLKGWLHQKAARAILNEGARSN